METVDFGISQIWDPSSVACYLDFFSGPSGPSAVRREAAQGMWLSSFPIAAAMRATHKSPQIVAKNKTKQTQHCCITFCSGDRKSRMDFPRLKSKC